jgi:hypothetical protein
MGVDYLELGKKKYKISLCDLLDLQLPLFGIKINSKIFGVWLKKKKKNHSLQSNFVKHLPDSLVCHVSANKMTIRVTLNKKYRYEYKIYKTKKLKPVHKLETLDGFSSLFSRPL